MFNLSHIGQQGCPPYAYGKQPVSLTPITPSSQPSAGSAGPFLTAEQAYYYHFIHSLLSQNPQEVIPVNPDSVSIHQLAPAWLNLRVAVERMVYDEGSLAAFAIHIDGTTLLLLPKAGLPLKE